MRKAFGLAFMLIVVAHSPSAHGEATPAERAACQQDAFRLCTHAIPDRERVRSCLRQNMRRISALCRSALQRSR
jgi:hypothetical protein